MWKTLGLAGPWGEPQKRMLLLLLTGLLACMLGFVTFRAWRAVEIVMWAAYPGMLITFGLFAWVAGRLLRGAELRRRWREGGWKIVLLVCGASAVVHLQEPHGFKVVNDEIIQVSTSQRMHATREAHIVSRAYRLGTNFVMMQGVVDKRPFFFPFLVSVLHDLTGYRPENAFVLNALLTPVLLGLVYLVAAGVAGRSGGVCAVLLIVTIPLLTQAAAGGGFEVLNLCMILATVYCGMLYARRPEADTLSAFCLAGILLAYVRYESVLFVFPVAAAILYVSYRRRKMELPWTVILSPLLLVLYPLQMNVVKLRPELLQLADRPSEHGLYSLAYFYDNAGRALRYFLAVDRSEPNSLLVFLGGVIGVGFFWMQLYRRHREMARERPEETVFSIFVVALCGQAVLMLCYFWGAYDDVVTVRLSLPTQLLFVLAFVYVLPLLAPKARHLWRVVGTGAVFYFLCFTLPTLATRAYALENLAAQTSNWHREFIHERADRDYIVVDSTMPSLWLAYGVASISYDTLVERTREFAEHFRWGTFSDCLIVQRMVVANVETGELKGDGPFEFGEALTLETVRQIRFRPNYVVRLSRITAINEEALQAWAEQRKAKGPAKRVPPDAAVEETVEEFSRKWLRDLP
jgi:Uncharacterized membrane protein, required for N-linked glycosylation